MNNKVVLSVSGGVDSSTLVGYYYDLGYKIFPLFFEYGSKHNKYEIEAVTNICKYFDIYDSLKIIKLDFINQLFKSNLLSSGGEIPEGHYNDENMRKTVVPSRNVIFISIMAGYAESINVGKIAIGVHQGDHHIYPDCRSIFIDSMKNSVNLASDGRVVLEAPFLYLDKTGILEVNNKFKKKVPYELTRTCYKNQPNACGKCGSCTERLEAFRKLGMVDPAKYDA